MPSPTPEPHQPVSLEQQRERAIDALSDHFAHDNLSLEELERRMELAYRAQSSADLNALTADLEQLAAQQAQVPATVAPSPLATPDRERLTSIMSETHRRGVWAVPQRLDVNAVMADTTIDLTQAILPSGIIDIHVRALMAAVKLIVPPGVRVASRVSAFMGSVNVRPDEGKPRPDMPVIRLSGWAFMAEVQTSTRHVEGTEQLPDES
jgi:cell wall-active antibiotic response 4TMS protein YvqF/uncharacterized protein DUF1707